MTNGCKCRHRKSGSNEKSTAQQNRRSDTKKSEVQHSRDRIWRNGSRSKTQCENSPESVASEHAWAPHSWRQRGLCVCVFFFLHSFSKKSLVRASTFGWLHCWPPGMEVFVKKTSHGAGGCPKTPLEKCCKMQG